MYKFTDEFWDYPPEPRRRRTHRPEQPETQAIEFTLSLVKQKPSLYSRFLSAFANFLFFVLKVLALIVLTGAATIAWFVFFVIMKAIL